MTITSQQIILPSRSSSAGDKNSPKPPPKVYNVKDFPFKGYQAPQPEGYQQSKASPSSSAIVIDNGTVLYSRKLLDLTKNLFYL
jgi:actin-related protein 5